jgi:perosamine synthetase
MATLIGSIPTIQSDDLDLALQILKGKINISGKTTELENMLLKIFENKNIYLFNRGREALYFILKTLGIKNSDEVMVQAMTCVAVVTPILWLSAKPVYVDINQDNYNIDIFDFEKKITPKAKAIIIQHTFGNIANIKKIVEIAKKHNMYVIEDCAHLFLTDYSNTEVNKYSDASFFSFAQDKSISCVQGGLSVINNSQFKDIAERNYSEIKNQNEAQALYNARYLKLWSTIKKYYFTPIIPFQKRVTIGKILVIIFRALGLIKKQASEKVESDISINKISNVQAVLLLNQLQKCNAMNKEREKISMLYNEKLKPEFANKTQTKFLLRYPILLKNPRDVINELKESQIICGRWYNSIIFPLNANKLKSVGYTSGDCPVAESVIKSIINLPTNIDLSTENAHVISEIVNRTGKPFKFFN